MMEGNLKKEARNASRSMQKRYFVLDENGSILTCKYTEQGKKIKKNIVLKESTYEGKEKELIIVVHANDRDWILKSTTKDEYANWIEALGKSDAKYKDKKKKLNQAKKKIQRVKKVEVDLDLVKRKEKEYK